MKRMFRTTIGVMALGAVLLIARTGMVHAEELGPVKVAVESETTGAAVDKHDKHGGEPKLIGPFSAGAIPALTSLVVFVLLLLVLGKYAWGPIASGLKAREDKIRKDIADAEAASARAEAVLKDYTAKLAAAEASAREIIAKAGTDAEAVAAQIRARSQAEAEEIKERALKDIDAAKNTAVREVYDQTAELATQVAEKILRRNLNASDQRDLVAQSLDQLQNVSKN